MKKINIYVQRGEIWMGDLGEGVEDEQQDMRPLLIIQNNTGNRYSKTTIVAPITSSIKKTNLPTHVFISEKFLLKDSQVLLEQVRAISKNRLIHKLGKVSEENQKLVDNALLVSVGLEKYLQDSVDN